MKKYKFSQAIQDLCIEYYNNYLKYAPNSDEKEAIKKKAETLASGEIYEEEGLLDKIIGFFTKK